MSLTFEKKVTLSLKADSKVSLKVSVTRYDKIRSRLCFTISIDVTKNCDYRFQSIKLTNQSTNIEYYRVLSINRSHFR